MIKPMTTQKTIKYFSNDIHLIVSDLVSAGFKSSDDIGFVSGLAKSFKSFKSSPDKIEFCNVSANPIDFLSVIFPNFSPNEIRELVSFLIFMNNIFSDNKVNHGESVDFCIENDNQGFTISSPILELNMNNNVLAIRGENLNKRLLKPLDIECHDIMYTLKKSLKSNLTFYFEDIFDVDTALINKMLNETVNEYFWRKNNSDIVKHLSDEDYIDHIFNLGKANMIRSKIPSLQLFNGVANIKKLYNDSYSKSIRDEMMMADNFMVQFQYQDLYQMRTFFEKIMEPSAINHIFQLIDLYTFRLKINGQFRSNDEIKVFRSNLQRYKKGSLPYMNGLCIQFCGLSMAFTDVVTLSDDICNDTDKLVSDNLVYMEQNYKRRLIKYLESKFDTPAQHIDNNSVLVYQMAII